jgi:hypothetical protein
MCTGSSAHDYATRSILCALEIIHINMVREYNDGYREVAWLDEQAKEV